MKISRIRSQILVMPQEDPLANTPEDPNAARPMVILRLDTDDGIEGIVAAAGRLKEMGFREMKTQLALPGDTSPAKEVERMVRVREAIGPDIKLMCDINQRWRVEQAIDIGKRVEDAGVGLFWLEDA